MHMLHYLDVAIGFSLAMTVLAAVIGTTTAMWLAAIRSKVRNLEHGLQRVLGALGGGLTDAEQVAIVKSLLRHKMMTSWSPVRWLGLGATEAVGREEFALLLLRAGTTTGGAKLGAVIQAISGQPPETTLRAVEKAILAEETAHPRDPAHVWRTRALAAEAPDLAARLFAQFDDVLARTDDNTAFSRKIVSALLALAFLTIYPVNAFDLLARLLNDTAIAASLAETAARETDRQKLRQAINDQGLFGDVFSDGSAHRRIVLQACPQGGPLCTAPAAVRESLSEPGIWTTFVLVSLGAPFWQGLLDKLLGFRSKISAKTEGERAHRAAQG